MLTNKAFYDLEKIIKTVIDDYEAGDEFCLYGVGSDQSIKNTKYWIDDYPDVSDDGEEIYPESVVENSLSYIYSGQQFADVIQNTVRQKKTATIKDFLAALDYYSKNDTFLDF